MPLYVNSSNFKHVQMGKHLVDQTGTLTWRILYYYIIGACNTRALALCLQNKVACTKSGKSAKTCLFENPCKTANFWSIKLKP